MYFFSFLQDAILVSKGANQRPLKIKYADLGADHFIWRHVDPYQAFLIGFHAGFHQLSHE